MLGLFFSRNANIDCCERLILCTLGQILYLFIHLGSPKYIRFALNWLKNMSEGFFSSKRPAPIGKFFVCKLTLKYFFLFFILVCEKMFAPRYSKTLSFCL